MSGQIKYQFVEKEPQSEIVQLIDKLKSEIRTLSNDSIELQSIKGLMIVNYGPEGKTEKGLVELDMPVFKMVHMVCEYYEFIIKEVLNEEKDKC